MTSPFGASSTIPAAGTADRERIAVFMRGVFWWMTLGLGVTALVATWVAGSPAAVASLVNTPLLFYGLLFAELGLVWYLSARVASMSPSTAGALFLLYSALNGTTFSLILLAYTSASVANAFFVSAAMFGAMAVYGHVTKRDLTAMGRFMFMGLIGLVIVSVISIFWHSDALQFSLGVVGVVVFAGLTAYDTQRLAAMATQTSGAQASTSAIVGALSLYLDFVNMFLAILRIIGRRK